MTPEINTNDFEKLNFFDKVNDFKWLKKTASPNFQVMEDPSSLENVILLLRETFDRCENEESKENLLIKVVLFNNE
ncbi:hypothetical protein HK099_007471 [Clydaea vesicula]|uniref:Uncharacterized protein n=1 Tax=Clydaea vesicula TaxID=447962 RepID=A0AAD5U187_9FUNG|nr:hypothetical protein HK099_007471 [Clydaea vesicula]